LNVHRYALRFPRALNKSQKCARADSITTYAQRRFFLFLGSYIASTKHITGL